MHDWSLIDEAMHMLQTYVRILPSPSHQPNCNLDVGSGYVNRYECFIALLPTPLLFTMGIGLGGGWGRLGRQWCALELALCV